MTGAGRILRALPTLLRIGVAETVAYRAEFLVWVLTTTQPLIMLGLWTSVADEGPFGDYSSQKFVAYFLASLIIRQLTGNWVAWQMSEEVQSGAMAMRLARLGIRHLKIADPQQFDWSNVNRQMGASAQNIGRNKAEVGLHPFAPGFGQLFHAQAALEQVHFQVKAHHDVKVVRHLVRIRAYQRSLDFVDSAIERLGLHPAELVRKDVL